VDLQYEWECPNYPETIVDAGANIGLTSILYATRYPRARILAIEPECSNFEMLRKNTESYSNITAVHAALWKEDCHLQIVDPGGDLWGFWGFRMEQRNELQELHHRGFARGVTLAHLMDEYSIDYIDLLKIDIEGAEKEVFESSASWIERVGAIVVELHDRFKPGCSDAVGAATGGFEVSHQRGDTTFLQRVRGAETSPYRLGSIIKPPKSHMGRIGVALPLSVESVV